ncbi:MAG TPA: ABC transporter permease [Desulfatiglandales bacterium]|nr:ABC transporter permease [Desulfatiglandales bacterium]
MIETKQNLEVETDLDQTLIIPSIDFFGRVRLGIEKFWKQRIGVAGAIVVISMCVMAIFAPDIAPYSPYEQDISIKLLPPFWQEGSNPTHILGTDLLGRDFLSRLIYGARVSLAAGFLSVTFAASLGITLGLYAGYYGKWVDSLISNAVNIMLGFPFILLALASIAIVGPSFKTIVIVLGITGWPLYARLVRSETLTIRELEYVEAARGIGCRSNRIIFRHIFPNVINSIIVVGTLEVARMIILESFLSFLGAGIQPPIPSWGNMLGEGRFHIFTNSWYITLPGIAIFVTTLGINMLGDGLRGLLDPYAQVKL